MKRGSKITIERTASGCYAIKTDISGDPILVGAAASTMLNLTRLVLVDEVCGDTLDSDKFSKWKGSVDDLSADIVNELSEIVCLAAPRGKGHERLRLSISYAEYELVRQYMLKQYGEFLGTVMGVKLVIDTDTPQHKAAPNAG